MKECRFCKSEKIVKNGFVWNKQRYKCKDCKRNFTEVKSKYTIGQKKRVIKAYIRGVGIRAIGDIEDIPFPLIWYWIKKLGKQIEEIKQSQNIDNKIIEVLEMDEMYSFIGKKSNEIRVWTAVDRNSLSMLDFHVGKGSIKEGKKLWNKIDKRYYLQIICTDGNFAYNKIIPKYKTHIVSKSETCLVESFNGRIRRNLARLAQTNNVL